MFLYTWQKTQPKLEGEKKKPRGGDRAGLLKALVPAITAALRCSGSPPGGRDAFVAGSNEPCRKHAFSITLGYLTT